jgi:hypothetical protein
LLPTSFTHPHSTNESKDSDYNIIEIEKVYFPPNFDVNIILEPPPISNQDGHSRKLQGIYQKYDFHAWFKVMTINIKNNFSFKFKITKCLGQF